MSKKKSPTSLSGGKGFGYEDYVAAKFLVDMLLGIPSFGAEVGHVQRVDWQAKDMRRLLDDLVITFSLDATPHVAECSVKMKRQVTRNGLPPDFVEAVWEQWLGNGLRAFDRGNDFFVLVTKNLADSVAEAFERLLKQAIATGTQSERLLERIVGGSRSEGVQASKLQRTLLESLHCPDHVNDGKNTGPAATCRLLQRIRLFTFDFKAEPSRDSIEAIGHCRQIVRSGLLQDARDLWQSLIFISSQLREEGGTIDLPVLLGKLRGKFDLTDYPDDGKDWATIHAHANDFFADIQTHVGGHSCLVRSTEVDAVLEQFSRVPGCILSGPSGSGKSAISKIVGLHRFSHRVVLHSSVLQSGRLMTAQSELGIRNELIGVVERCSGDCLLVFDALDKCTDEGLRLAGRLIADILGKSKCGHVKLLISAQDDLLDKISATLAASGVLPGVFCTRSVPLPSKEAVALLAANAPGFAFQNLNDDLKSLLQNLKILDWVLLAAKSGCDLNASGVTGLISLIDFLWKSWIETGEHSIGRSGLLKRIAEMEASSFSIGVPLDQLATPEHQVLKSLEADSCVRLCDERVSFSHDLLGDWARLRLLVTNDPTVGETRRRCAAEPRWHRAVRLYGRWLLSRDNNAERWRLAIARVDDDQPDGAIIRDLLLEAMLVAENSATLLQQCWSTLIANDGRLLRRLLDRLLVVGTVPDPRFVSLFVSSDIRSQLEAKFRLPNCPTWFAVAMILDERVTDVVRLASTEAAKVCHLFLTKMPVMTKKGNIFPARSELGRVAIEIAKECQRRLARDEWMEESIAQTAYEALLAAASESPDDVTEIMLQLAHRRPPSEELNEIAAVARKARVAYEAERQKDPQYAELIRVRNSAPSFIQRGKRRKPWPDGPSDRLPNGLQEAILSVSAIIPLASSRPEIAVELLLAASIEDPQYQSWDGGSLWRDDCGIEDWDDGYPPLYLRGPFLPLLHSKPDAGLDYAIRLVNFATKRYLDTSYRNYSIRSQRDGVTPAKRVDPQIELEIEGKQRQWLGNDSMFRWHLECSFNRKLALCVLMAIEKWLEQLLESGQDIEPYVRKIMLRSESVAFAGVLNSVAKRDPSLLKSSMLPLLGVLDLYFWDRYAIDASFGAKTWEIAWSLGDKPLADLARKWHTAEHRMIPLIELTTTAIAESDSLHPFFSQCCSRWESLTEANDADLVLATLIAQLNPGNYRAASTTDAKPRFIHEPPKGLTERQQERTEGLNEPYPQMLFPMQCRKAIESGRAFDDETAEAVFLQTQKFAAATGVLSPLTSGTASAVMGGIAVLLNLARPWLLAESERMQWCENQLETLLQTPPSREEFEFPDTPSQWNWESFVCEAAVLMLAAGRDSSAIRELSARGVVAYHYETISRTMLSVFENRETLGDDFHALQALAMRWSFLRRTIEHTTYLQSNLQSGLDCGFERDGDEVRLDVLNAKKERRQIECDDLIEDFVDRSIKPLSISEAQRLGVKAQREIDEQTRPKIAPSPQDDFREIVTRRKPRRELHRADICIDTQVISSAFCWLGARAAWQPDRSRESLELVQEIRDLLLGSLPRDPQESDAEMSDHPTAVDGWMYDIVARAICLSASPSVARELWRPIVTLPVHLHDWTERFFWSWFSDGYAFSASPEQFVAHWKEMIELAITLPSFDLDRSRQREVSELVFNLLGLKYPAGNLAKDAEYADAIASMADVWERVAQKWLHLPLVGSHFAMILIQPAFARLLCSGVKWLAFAVSRADDYPFWRERDIESSMVSVLNECWERHSDEIKIDNELRMAFNELLTTLASRGSHPATVLRDRVLDSLGQAF